MVDTTVQLQKELSALQSELDRIVYLLKIADPTGEAAKKKDSKVQASKSRQQDIPKSAPTKQLPVEQKKKSMSEKSENGSTLKEGTPNAITQAIMPSEADKNVAETIESKIPVYTATKPLWLGAIQDMEIKVIQQEAQTMTTMHEPDQFVDYKDRKKTLGAVDDATVKSELESAAPGLIIRKQKQVEKPGRSDKAPEQSTSLSAEAETTAADAVALLLKHKRGYIALEDEGRDESQDIHAVTQSRKDSQKSRRVLGPERPAFLNSSPDYESWVPPEGE